MTSVPTAQLSAEALAVEFLRQSQGEWVSQRRYYTLKPDVETQEIVSYLSVKFLERGCPELFQLAQLHGIEEAATLAGGSYVTWRSEYTGTTRKPAKGSTIFGVLGDRLYRDRGFATAKPVIAIYTFNKPSTLCLRTEYNGSVFEEEIKLIGEHYRTRQTIISRAGEEVMIGQYLEKRLINEQ